MYKYLFIIFLLLGTQSYSQDINLDELKDLPPDVRDKFIEVLVNDKENVRVRIDKNLNNEQETVKKKVNPRLTDGPKVVPLDKEKALEAVKQLGANHFKIRKQAKKDLTAMGYLVVPILKDALKENKDPEVTESLKEIIHALSRRLHVNQLTKKQKAVAILPFSSGFIEGSKVDAEFYNAEGHFIIDVGVTRLVFPGEVKQLMGTSRSNVGMIVDSSTGSSGTSTSNDFTIYRYSYEEGTGYWTICDHSFTVRSFILNISDKKLYLKPEVPQVLYFDKTGKPIGILDLK